MASLYSVEGLTFTVKQKTILRDVSFEAGTQEYIAVIGPNGAGKTTLLRHLNRIIRPQKPESVILKQKPIESYTQKEIARTVSYVPQSPTHIHHFSVREFILMGRYPYLGPFASPAAEDESAVDESMAVTGVSGFADRDMVTLSGGELQKVYIAAGLAQSGEIILLDEPTTFLDPGHQHEIFKILRDINRQGRTVISVTHDINTAVLTASRIMAMKNGMLVFDGNGEEVMDNSIIGDIYERSFTFTVHPETGKKIAVPEAYLLAE